MKIRPVAVAASLLLMSVAVSTTAHAASAGGACKKIGRTVVAKDVHLRCTKTKSSPKWKVFMPVAVPSVVPSVVPVVSVEPKTLQQSGVLAVTSNVVGTVYLVEAPVKVSSVADIESTGRHLWMSARVASAGVNSIDVDITSIVNGYYHVYVADEKGVLSAPASTVVVVSMTRSTCERNRSRRSTDFAMKIDTTLTAANEIELPLAGAYSVSIDWGDGTCVETFANGSGTVGHVYAADGTYTILVSGTLERFGGRAFPWPGVRMLTEVISFGDLGIFALSSAFEDAVNLLRVPDELPSSVTVMSWMFEDAVAFNDDISGWDVSNVTRLRGTFEGAAAFNQDISGWDVSKVTSMSAMFYGAGAFNQNISGWNVSNVTNMQAMFVGAYDFDQSLNTWNVSNVTDMNGMFVYARSFNQNISGWNVSRVTDMSAMFQNASNFNQDLESWNVASGVLKTEMFAGSAVGTLPTWYA